MVCQELGPRKDELAAGFVASGTFSIKIAFISLTKAAVSTTPGQSLDAEADAETDIAKGG